MDAEQIDEANIRSLQRLVLQQDEPQEEEVDDYIHSDDHEMRIVSVNVKHNLNNAAILKLPREVLAYILRWVVSDRIDVGAFYNWSLVCKDFYMLTQDAEFWVLLCRKIWGANVRLSPYSSWKTAFLSKPHIHMHGVYISRTTYVRTGDSSCLNYRPYYYVEYFRILRFLPNDEVMMLTTPKDPREVVHKLNHKNRKVQGLLVGKYQLHSERKGKKSMTANITAKLESYYTPKVPPRQPSGRGYKLAQKPACASVYKLEMELLSTSANKKFNKLVWVHHSCSMRYGDAAEVDNCVYDVSRQYPALYFNQIRSFTAESYRPL